MYIHTFTGDRLLPERHAESATPPQGPYGDSTKISPTTLRMFVCFEQKQKSRKQQLEFQKMN